MAEAVFGTQDNRDSRFAFLLQPIRDLAENWNIDIAAELEEYIDELDNVTFSIEGEGPSLNFAEAALLIQGSTCVYSKKVEHLHNLVYLALQTINLKKHKSAAAAAQAGGAAADVDDVDDALDAEAFLTLDDTLQECDNIDLAAADDEHEAAPGLHRAPAALLALEDLSTGEGDGDAGCYRLAQCFVHASGALLLEGADVEGFDADLGYHPNPQPAAAVAAGAAAAAVMAVDYDADYDSGGDDGGGGYDDAGVDDEFEPLPPPHLDEAAPQPADPAAVQAAAGAGAGLAFSTPGGAVTVDVGGVVAPGGVQAGDTQEEEYEYFDPYKPLDMHDPGTLPIRPLKVCKPPAARIQRQQHQARVQRVATAKTGGTGGKLQCSEFAYALSYIQQEPKTRPSAAAAGGGRRHVGIQPPLHSMLDWSDAAAVAEQERLQQEVDLAGDDAGPLEQQQNDLECGAGALNDGDDMSDGGFDAAMEEAVMDGCNNHSRDIDMADGIMPDESMSYQELCRAHMDALLAAAAAQEVQTELALRVSSWRQRISPILEAEQERNCFDIHVYSEKILEQLTDLTLDAAPLSAGRRKQSKAAHVGQSLPFGAVIKAKDKFEVSRTFAAMLQLINSQNIAIHKAGQPDAPFQLELLTSELAHESMGEGVGAAAAVAAPTAQNAKAAASAGHVAEGAENAPHASTRPPLKKKARGAKGG